MEFTRDTENTYRKVAALQMCFCRVKTVRWANRIGTTEEDETEEKDEEDEQEEDDEEEEDL
jgi:hypothetical protein